jgi:hypothetical protein
MADKNEAMMRRLAEKAAYRRRYAKDNAAMYDAGIATRPKFHHFEVSDPPTDNTRGEFLVGPLRGEEARTYSRAKGAVARKKKK